MVYEFCDLPTLYRLMKTCSIIRHDTTPIFWGHPDTRYHVHVNLILAHSIAPLRYWCADFAAGIQQVEIVSKGLGYLNKSHFWEAFRDCFPPCPVCPAEKSIQPRRRR